MAAEKKLPIDVALATISTLSDLVRQDSVEPSDVAVADAPKTRRDPIPLPPIREPVEIQSVLRPMTAMEVMMRELNILRSRIDELEDDDGPDYPIQPSGASSVSPFRTWRPLVDGDTVHIYDCVLSRSGIRLQEDHLHTTVTTDGWNDLYVVLTSSAGDPAVKPDGMTLYAAAHPLADSDYSDICVRCGTARLTSGAVDRIQVTKDNDHDNSVIKPDSAILPSATTNTLEVDQDTGGMRLYKSSLAASRNKYLYLDNANTLQFVDVSGASTYDVYVAVDSAATPGYLGANYNDGVLRVDNDTIIKTDGVDFITLSGQKSIYNSGDADYTFGLLPPGGSTYMVLQKASGTDYRVKWDWTRAHA